MKSIFCSNFYKNFKKVLTNVVTYVMIIVLTIMRMNLPKTIEAFCCFELYMPPAKPHEDKPHCTNYERAFDLCMKNKDSGDKLLELHFSARAAAVLQAAFT